MARTRRTPAGRARALAAGLVSLLLLVAGCAGRPARPAIVLVLIDTLRRDHVGAYGYARNTTPVIDALAADGLRFEDAIAQSSWTFPSLASLFTSRYASEVAGLRRDREPRRGLPDASVTLAEELASAGYRTIAISGSPYTMEPFALMSGFDRTLQRFGVSAEELVDLAIQEIDAHRARAGEREPLFLYLHLMDVHTPYHSPPPYDTMFSGSSANSPPKAGNPDHPAVIALYDGSLRFADAQLGRLVERLERVRQHVPVVLVVASDHGEALWDRTALERELGLHGVNGPDDFGYGHGHTLFPELIRVPLVFWGDGVPVGIARQPVRNLDVAPTLLALAEAGEGFPGRGVDLIERYEGAAAKPLPLVSETSIGEGAQKSYALNGYKFLRLPDRELLFERNRTFTDVTEQHPELVERYRERLDALTSSFASWRGASSEIDPARRRQLRALGYAQESPPEARR